MGVYTTLPENLQEVDVVIAGGGTASCVVASRLSDAYPDLSILVVESGRDSYNVRDVIHPLLWPGSYPPGNRVHYHMSVEEPQLGGRQSILQVGNTLGGGSAINLMMYARGQGCDFDSWKTKGWTAKDLLPYLKKFETYHGQCKKDLHGHDGPVHISRGTHPTAEGVDDFLQAMGQVGFPEVEDLHDLESIGASRTPRYISPQGKRSDASHAYLHPRLQDGKHPNLHVLVETLVPRILFDADKKATGLEVQPNPVFQPDAVQSGTKTVKARKLVIASCGSLGTPPLLERSGVGNPKILEAAGVPVIAELPTLGENYQDHHLSIYPYANNLPPDQTTDAVHGGKMSAADQAALAERNDPLLGWNGVEVSSKIRPTSSEVEALGAEFKKAWDRDFRNTPSRPLVSMIQVAGLLWNGTVFPDGQYYSIGVYTAYPYSRGSIHITSKDVNVPPKLVTGFLSDENGVDIKSQIWAYKKQREVARHMSSIVREEKSRPGHPVFPEGSPAAVVFKGNETGGQKPTSTLQPIEYTAEDDKAIEEAIRNNVMTTWHGLGTAKMAPKEAGGIVDENLNVYGVRGLKIADMSIVPENVCANTMNTALLVGEKASDIFIQELRNL